MRKLTLAEAIDEGFLNRHNVLRTFYVKNGIVFIKATETEMQTALAPVVYTVHVDDIANSKDLLSILAEIDEVLRLQGISLIERRGFIRTAVTLIIGLLISDTYSGTTHLFALKQPQLDIQSENLILVRFVEELPETEDEIYYVEVGEFEEDRLIAHKLSLYSWVTELIVETLNLSYYSRLLKGKAYDEMRDRAICEPTTKVIIRTIRDHCFSGEKSKPFDANSFRHEVIAAQFSSQTEKI